MIILKRFVTSAVLLAGVGVAQAQSVSGSFDCITDNSPASCAQGESALSYTWDGSTFSIYNAAGGGYVAEVYFDLGTGMGAAFNAASSSGGVLFAAGASPSALPGGNAVGFSSDEAFDSDGGRGQPVNGINGGEWAAFTITGSNGSLDFLSGLHVRSLANGQSEGFVTISPVPEPSTYALMLAGLGIMGFVARRRRQEL